MTNTNYDLAKAFMLASTHDNNRQMLFPQIVMKKYDGLRAMWLPDKQAFVSRQGVIYEHVTLSHIKPVSEYRLDGELIIPGQPLQVIASTVTPNRQTRSEHSDSVRYVVYDALIPQRFATSRMTWLQANLTGANVMVAEWRIVTNYTEFQTLWQQWVLDEDNEGLMTKWPVSYYTGGRSPCLQKHKLFEDAEFVVTGLNIGEGKYSTTLGALECQAANGKTFTVSGFNDSLRAEIWHNGAEFYKGKLAKVKYQTLSPDGIPLHPSFLAFV